MGRLSVDRYLAWRFHIVRCNCWAPVRAGWLELTGVDLGELTPADISTDALKARFDSQRPRFRLLERPADPSIVLMMTPGMIPHVGLYHRRKVLQMTEGGGSYMPLATATAGWRKVEFYIP